MQTIQEAVHRRSRMRWILPLIALLMVAAVVGPPLVSLNRLHRRIADSISRGIGRPVRMSSIKMRLLPRPGFELADFAVEEDPAFGAEPILRSGQVMAYVRLLSLWRGRLEIARIAFDEPSLNLVRNRHGRWNFESLLSQAAQIPKAPTGERHPGELSRFPYIDASNARVNFKLDDEKMPFSFLNAELAVWLANPSEWKIQFAAQPVRTDLSLDLANTGLVRLEGSLLRAPALTQMPINLHAEWVKAPLGQLSRILTGSDANWRGQLDAAAEITGSADHASLKINARGSGIHRVEFQPSEALNIDATCQAQFTRSGRVFDAITCLAPAGQGHLLLTGSVSGLATSVVPALSLEINHVPIASAFDGLRLLRSNFAPMVRAGGIVDGNFSYDLPPASTLPRCHGQATAHDVIIAAPSLARPLVLPPLHFTMDLPAPERPRRGRAMPVLAPSPEAEIVLEPFSIRPSLATGAQFGGLLNVGGIFNRSGFTVHVGGQSGAGEIVALGREFGLLHSQSVNFGPQGTAEVDLTAHGPWVLAESGVDHAMNPATIEGSMHLRNAQVTGPFLAQPLQIGAAQAFFAAGRINWSASSLTYGPLHGSGTLVYPAFCDVPDCGRKSFSLHIPSLEAGAAQQAFRGSPHGELVRQLLDRIDRNDRAWPDLQGRVQIDSLLMNRLQVRDLNAAVSVAARSLKIDNLSCAALDGTIHLDGLVQLTDSVPQYAIEAQVDHADAAEFAELFHENWGPGRFDLTTTLKLSGLEKEQLLSSAAGSFHVSWLDGALAGESSSAGSAFVADAKASFLNHFDQWTADGRISQGSLTLDRSNMQSSSGMLPWLGTIGFTREIDLTSPGHAGQLRITGTLEQPHLSGAVETRPVQSAP